MNIIPVGEMLTQTTSFDSLSDASKLNFIQNILNSSLVTIPKEGENPHPLQELFDITKLLLMYQVNFGIINYYYLSMFVNCLLV